jgi:osmotically-inducible protein OsmY
VEVTNDIRVQPRVKATDVRDKIEVAFKRVNVTAQDGKVILIGNVHS